MKTTICLGFTLGLMAAAVGSVFAQSAAQTADVEGFFKPVTIRTSTAAPSKLPAPYQVERAHRNFADSGTSLLGPMGDPLVDFLSWVDKIDKASRSPGGIPFANGSILRHDEGNALMIEPTNLYLKRKHIYYGIAPAHDTAGPAVRLKF